jgi:hypothetical protein
MKGSPPPGGELAIHKALESKEPGERPGSLLLSLRVFLLLPGAPLLPEALDTAGCVDELLTAREVRVANRTDVQVDVLACTARLELVAARAVDGRYLVLWMNAFFHTSSLFSLWISLKT